jgi:SAM-dependent methyltransferase
MEPAEYILGSSQTERARLLAQCQIYVPETQWLLDHLGIKAGGRALDMGCGPLGILDLLSAHVGPTGVVVGLERDPRMLEWAQSSVAERHLSNVQLIGGDAEATGLPRASFDLAHARLLLINVRHPDRILSEMVAVVRPGGLVIVQEVDWCSWTCEPFHPAWGRLLRVNQTVHEENGEDPFIGRRLPGLLRSNGLRDVGVKAHVHLWHRGDPLHTQLLAFTEIARRRILERGLLTDVELNGLVTDLEAHLQQPGTMVIHTMLFQAWGFKARDQ